MFKLSYYVFDFENKYCCLFLINKGTLLYDQPSCMMMMMMMMMIYLISDMGNTEYNICHLDLNYLVGFRCSADLVVLSEVERSRKSEGGM
jgi:hypothetical protein